MGNSTLNAANNIIDDGNVDKLYKVFREKRIDYYNHRADTVTGAQKFRNGWLTRANSFKYY